MALKRNFEDISGLESPFVDEVVNPGVPGTSPAEVERQAIRSNQLFLAQQKADQIIKGPRPETPRETKFKDKIESQNPRSVAKDLKTKRSKFQAALAAAQGR